MYQKGRAGWLKHIDFLILDWFCVNLSFITAFLIRYQGNLSAFNVEANDKLLLMINIIAVLVALLSHAYKNMLKRGMYKELVETVKYTVLVFLASVFYLYALNDSNSVAVRETLYITVGVMLPLDYICRLVWKRIVRFRLARAEGTSMLVVTTSGIAEKVVNTLENKGFGNFKIAGIVIIDKNLTGKKIKGVPVVAGVQDAADYVCREWVDEVFVDVHSEKMYPKKLISEFETMGLVIHERLANSSDTDTNRKMVEKICTYTVLTSTINSASPLQLFVKRFFDIIGGVVGCIVTGILFIFVAPLIYIKSPGPVIFKQERVGKNGKKFMLYKFRTMYLDAEERKQELMSENRVKDGMMFKIEFDERIIGCKKLKNGKIKRGIGGWIRRLSIDEFPQFLNVLKGEMSMVGTRPPTVDEWEKYELHHRARLAIKPGITGMWQVNGRSKITDFEKVVKLDTMYIREWKISLDVKILVKTVFTVFKREGSM